jgi:hypothetical protein
VLLAAVACSIEKKEPAATGDTTMTSVPETTTRVPTTLGGGGTSKTGNVDIIPIGKKVRDQTKISPPGGERDSVAQPVYEVGPDGKVRRIKR